MTQMVLYSGRAESQALEIICQVDPPPSNSDYKG